MAQEFYLKTRALHEEFQKRELHFLNSEKKLQSSIMSKASLNLPLQEYLQRINQREKESEATYKCIMKQMEQLDRHTDELSSKLETLGILQSNLTSVSLQNWSSTLGSNHQISGFTPKPPSDPVFESLEQNVKSTYDLKSISTQTEDKIYCEKCNYLIHGLPKYVKENESKFVLSAQSDIKDVSQEVHSSKSKETSCTVSEIQKNSLYVASSEINDQFTLATSLGNSLEKDSSLEQKINKLTEENIHSDIKFNEIRGSVENQLELSKKALESVENINVSNEEKISESRHSEDEGSPGIEVDTFGSKSDVESINNEFDFLESETKTVSSKIKDKPQDNLKNHKSLLSNVDESIVKQGSLMVEKPNEPSLKDTKKVVFHQNSRLDISDNKSETSGSVSAPHSPNVSVSSDSDSIYEKGSSLKVSAAYQALLGNTVIPKKIKREVSVSESEDEVESALANVVQSSHVKTKSSKTNQLDEKTNNKSPSQATDSKPSTKGSKPPSINNPQSKLSKNTRKVLGLDTSSGSEVELTVKSPEKKVDEDSDEFGFYD